MAIRKQIIPVSLGLGLNTKVDKFQMTGGLLELENSFQVKTGQLQTRNGYNEFTNNTIGAPEDPILPNVLITNAVGLSTYNNELIEFSNDKVWSWAPQINKWAFKGPIVHTDISTKSIVSNSYEQTSYDMAIARGLAIYAWEDSRGGVHSQVSDLDSGAILIRDTQLNINAIRPRCFGIGQYLFVFYYDTVAQTLYARRVSTIQPDVYSAEVVTAADINPATPYFDVCQVDAARMLIAYRNDSNLLKLAYYLQTNQVGGVITGSPDPTTIATIDPDLALTCYQGEGYSGSPTFHILWGNSSTGVSHQAFYQDFTTYLPELVLDAYSTTIRNISGIAYDIYTDIYWETPGATVLQNYVTGTWIDLTTNQANTGDPPVILQRSAGLASKAYRGPGGLVSSILVSHETQDKIQNCYFAINNITFVFANPALEGQIEAQILSQAGAGHTVKDSCVPSVWVYGDDFVISCGKQSRSISGTTNNLSLISFDQIELRYDNPLIGVSTQLGGNLFIPGGFLKAFDGVTSVEQNYLLFPEQPAITDAYSGNIADGTYQYVVVWEWIDAQGQIFQSEPSIPVSFTVSGGPKEVELEIATLTYTDKKPPYRTSVIVSVYRTENGGTLFYKVTDDTNPVLNDLHADSVIVADNISDANLISRPLIYTTGGVLENIPSPTANIVHTAKNRLFTAGGEFPNQVAFSKEFVVNESVNFAPGFTIQVDTTGGPITAISDMDEKVIIFKQHGIYYLTGDGPNDIGVGSFTVTRVATDIGCLEPESIVLTPEGLMFKSLKGIWILNRGLTTEYIGAQVEQFNSLNISSAVVVGDLNQVRFTTEEGTTLVYDYYFKQWGTFTNQASIAATNWQGNYVFVHRNGLVWIEDRTSYADNNVPIVPVIGTQWFSFAQLQGFQRILKAQILGAYVGEHKLKVSVYYDFRTSPEDVFYYDLTANLFGTTYGEPIGQGFGDPDGSLYGLVDGIYQFQIDFKIQKCEALRLVIEGVFPQSTGTPAFSLSAVSFLVGIKKGLNRMVYTKTMSGSN